MRKAMHQMPSRTLKIATVIAIQRPNGVSNKTMPAAAINCERRTVGMRESTRNARRINASTMSIVDRSMLEFARLFRCQNL